MLIIKDKLGADVVATYDYDYSGTFMEDRKVSAVVETPTPIAFEIGSTITYRGEVFTFQEDPTPRRVFSSLMITYNLTFYSAGYDLGLVAFYDIVKDDTSAYNRSSNLEVFVFGTVFQLMDRIVANMDRAGHTGWTHDINPTLILEVRDISLVNAYCSDAVGLIKSLFGLDYIIYGKDIRVGYDPVSASETVLSFGMNHGLCEISRIKSENKVITRAVGHGSNRNIPPDYRVDAEHPYNPRLMLPAPGYISDVDLEAEFGIREGICPVNEDIYPSIEGATYAGLPIDEIVSVLPYNDKDATTNVVVAEAYYEKVNDPANPLITRILHPAVTKQVEVTASTTVSFMVNDPGFSIYDDDIITTSPAAISMKTGYMQGVEFKIIGFVKDGAQYKVTIERDSSDTNHVIPNLIANLAAGDKFVYLDIFLPSTYIADAESKLVTYVTDWLNEQLYAPRAYAITLSEEWLAEEPTVEGNLFEGKTLPILDTQIGLGFPEEILIQSLTISHKASNIFPTYNITVSPTKIAGVFGQMQNQLKNARLSGMVSQTTINNSIQNVLKSINTLERHLTTTERDINGNIIAPQSIYNNSLSIETRGSNYVLQAYLKVNYLGDADDVYGSAGTLIHKDADVVWGNVFDLAHQTWTITTPQTWTLEPYTTYWAYIKCNTTDGTAVWVLSETKIGVLSLEGYYMFEWGQIMQFEAGFRVTQTTYGGTTVEVGQQALNCVGTKTANYNANPFELIPCDISNGSFSVILPDDPIDGTIVYVKLNAVNDSDAGVENYLTLATSGTGHFNTPTGTVEIYMYLFGEYAQMQYCADTGVWTTFISAATYNWATQFPGIDASTPITANDISINYTTRILTITPPLGYFNTFTDGGGVITRFRKVGVINFPAWNDTSGIWYLYFNNLGQAVTQQTAWNNFATISAVYRVLWNNLLYGFTVTSANATIGATYTNNGKTYTVVDTIAAGTYLRMSCSTGLPQDSGTLTLATGTGDATITFSAFTESEKSVGEDFECHENTISADDHAWKHKYGSIWFSGQDIFHNRIVTGIPDVSGLNTCIGLSGGMNFDDNLSWTVINGTGTDKWTQDLGTNIAGSLTTLTGGKFAVRYQIGSSVYNLPITRFPFAFSVNNIIEFIDSSGVRTEVSHTNYTAYFMYSFPDPRTGLTIKMVSVGVQYTSLILANAATWNDIKAMYPTLNDGEIRPLYRLIYESRTGYDVAVKKAALRDVADIRTAQVVISTGGGAGAVGDHSTLTNLVWGNSAHTGTANKAAGFGASGETIYFDRTTQITGLTLLSGSWTLISGLYEYDLANANITANSVVDVIPDNADISIIKTAEILPKTVSSAGSVKMYSTNAPSGNIGITIVITDAI